MDDVTKTMRIDLLRDAPSTATKIQPKTQAFPSQYGAQQPGRSKTPDSVLRATYHDFLQYLYDAVLVTGPTGKIVDFNERSEKLFLYKKNEFPILHIENLISGADESLINSLCSDLEEKRFTVIQAYCMRQDGSFFPAEIVVNNLKLGTMQLSFFVRDITVRKHAEEMLRVEHYALHNAWSGVAILDLEGKIIYANPAFAGILGYQLAETLVDRRVSEMISDEKSFTHLLESALSDQQTWSIETQAIKHDKTLVDVKVFATCILSTENAPSGIVLSCVDISEQKQLQDELREAKQLLGKDTSDQASINQDQNN